MFNEARARNFVEGKIQKSIQIQQNEYKRWQQEPGFSFDRLAKDPEQLFWWMMSHKEYLKPFYDQARSKFSKFSSTESVPAQKLNTITGNLSGGTNEVLAYFVGVAETIEDPDRDDEIIINKKNSANLIEEDANFTIKNRPGVRLSIEGKIIGGFSPDAIRLSQRRKRVISVIENTIHCDDQSDEQSSRFRNKKQSVNQNYQENKVGNLRIAKKQHPLLFHSKTYIEIGLPEDSQVGEEVDGIDTVYWGYPLETQRKFLKKFYQEFHPYGQPTLAEVMPQLRTHHLLGGELSQRHSKIYLPAYTHA